jgi:hypothetical protein
VNAIASIPARTSFWLDRLVVTRTKAGRAL